MGTQGGKLWRTVWEGRGTGRVDGKQWADRLKSQGFEVRVCKAEDGREDIDKARTVQVRGNRDVQMRAMSWLPRRGVVPQWWHEDPRSAAAIAQQIAAELAELLKHAPTHTCGVCEAVLPYNPNIPGYYCNEGCGLQHKYRMGVGPQAPVAQAPADDEDPPF